MSATIASAPVVLERASQAFVEATSKPPFLYELTLPRRARSWTTSRAPIDKLAVENRWIMFAGDQLPRIC